MTLPTLPLPSPMSSGTMATWCLELCVSSATSALCNRSHEACPPCVRRTALGVLMCSSTNCSATATTFCPAIIPTSTIPHRPTTTPNATNASMVVTTPLPTILVTTTPRQPDMVAPISSSSTILPTPTLLLVLAVSGSFLVCLAGCAWMYRRRRVKKQDMDVNLSIVRHRKHAKAYNPALASCKLDEFDMHGSSYNHPRSTSRTQSMSKGSWQESDGHWSSTDAKPPPFAHGIEPDPWVFTNPYRRSSVVELGGDSFSRHDDQPKFGRAYDSIADDTRSSCSSVEDERGSSPMNTVILGRR